MLENAQHLPGSPPLSSAWALWRAGEYSACVSAITQSGPIEDAGEREAAFLLYTRCLLKLGQDDRVIADLRTAGSWASVEAECTAAMFYATALVRTEEPSQGIGMLRAIIARTQDVSSELRGEAAYQLALALWSSKQYDLVDDNLAIAMVCGNVYVKALALEMRAWQYARQERYRETVNALIETFAFLRTLPERYHALEGHLLYMLAIFAADMNLPDLVRELRSADVRWTSDMRRSQFGFLRQFAWFSALHGDVPGALGHLSAASEIAPSAAWKVVARLERLLVVAHIDTGTNHLANEEIRATRAQAEAIDWESTKEEERYGLLLLAELLSRVDPQSALTQVERYERITTRISPLYAYRNDRRLLAHELYTKGLVMKALGQRYEALALLNSSFEIWEAIGYEWRAARAAARMQELEHAPARATFIGRVLAALPQSWLRAELRVEKRHDHVKLTKAQHAVLSGICDGLTNREIAKRLGSKENTVRSHVRAILRAHNLESRWQIRELYGRT